MEPGKLRHKVDIEQAQITRDKLGGEGKHWVVCATVWADIQPLRGTEALVAQQVKATLSHKVRLRYDLRIIMGCRIKYGSRTFQINSIRDVDEKHEEMETICSEVVL